jgi:hydroxyethylthiazole kinase-like uncharacterized protein yjeF
MKILSAAQTRLLDQATIQEQNLTSEALMERAAGAFAEWFLRCYGQQEAGEVLFLIGPGNNGGDGLAVARMLHMAGYQVQAVLLPAENHSPDWLANRQLLPSAIQVEELNAGALPPLLPGTLVIDALFGTGLNRALEDPAAAVVQWLNEGKGTHIISIDLPSGLFADAPQASESLVVKAHKTVSFGLPKLAFFLPQNAAFLGEWEVLDINLSASFIAQTDTPWQYTDAASMTNALPQRPKFAHKGTFGHALLLAGSRGKIGAAVLAARACLRGGVGLLTVRVPGHANDILQTAMPEAMSLADPHPELVSELPELRAYQAVGIGPGLGQEDASLNVLRQLLQAANAGPEKLPLVIDADALNLLGANRELLTLLPPDTVLSPHPKEFERLTEPARDDYHRLNLLRDFAQARHCYVVLKGAYSCLATPEGTLHFNSTGNPGMATGGSGDVLTGLLLALRANKQLSAFEVARLAVFAHGRAGDLAAATTGQTSLIAGDLVTHLGAALLTTLSTNT